MAKVPGLVTESRQKGHPLNFHTKREGTATMTIWALYPAVWDTSSGPAWQARQGLIAAYKSSPSSCEQWRHRRNSWTSWPRRRNQSRGRVWRARWSFRQRWSPRAKRGHWRKWQRRCRWFSWSQWQPFADCHRLSERRDPASVFLNDETPGCRAALLLACRDGWPTSSDRPSACAIRE